MDSVAKVRIRVSRAGERHYLMSVKRAEGKRKHGKLELLGGHVEEGEGPLDGLVRELAEEENSGTLSERVRALAPKATNLHVAGAQHHVFDLEIDPAMHEDILELNVCNCDSTDIAALSWIPGRWLRLASGLGMLDLGIRIAPHLAGI